VDPDFEARGGVAGIKPILNPSPRKVFLLQRKNLKIGIDLGASTGWIHRSILKRAGVQMLRGCCYEMIDDAGVHLTHNGERRILEVDSVIICAGQEPFRKLYDELVAKGVKAVLIGGANVASELNAKRAINQGARLGAAL
jgi:2,4-dienoyl-CoA reductase (NADPH2)